MMNVHPFPQLRNWNFSSAVEAPVRLPNCVLCLTPEANTVLNFVVTDHCFGKKVVSSYGDKSYTMHCFICILTFI